MLVGQGQVSRRGERARAVVQVEAVAQRRPVGCALDATADHVEVDVAVAVHVDEEQAHVFTGGVALDGGLGPGLEAPVVHVAKELRRLSPGTTEGVVVVAVPVKVGGGQARAQGREAPGQQGLAGVIVEGLLDGLSPQRACKHRPRQGSGPGPRRRFCGLGDDEALIGGEIVEALHMPAGPLDHQARHPLFVAQAKVCARAGASHEAPHGCDQSGLSAGGGVQPHHRAQRS